MILSDKGKTQTLRLTFNGEPDAGNLHVRFGEGLGGGSWPPPRLLGIIEFENPGRPREFSGTRNWKLDTDFK